jgi:hypothetical protein
MPDPLLEFVMPHLANFPGVSAVVLGGPRARTTATVSSDYDLGLYFGADIPFDTTRLLEVVKDIVDDPDTATVYCSRRLGAMDRGGQLALRTWSKS